MVTPLLELGLNKYEAKVYLTLISEGISTAKNISDITGIPYGKVYEIINSLAGKGFALVLPSKPMKCQAISPREAITAAKKDVHEKFEKLEKQIEQQLEPIFTESKKFVEPKGVFWIINGRSNIIKKIEELIQKAKSNISIHCSANGLSRLILHKEALEEAKNRGVTVNIATTVTKEVMDEAKSLFGICDIRKTKNAESHLFSVDRKECLVIEPIPDDDNIVYGRDLGIWVSSSSFVRFLETFYESNFNKARKIQQPIKAKT
jgi:sugar-specific transcriptional regulator TrmB